MLTPPTGEKAYPLAGEALADLWEKVTGQRPVVRTWKGAASQNQGPQEELPEGDLALIGSDAVHPLVHQLIRQGALESLGIQYGSDEYRLACVPHQGRRCLILAGARGDRRCTRSPSIWKASRHREPTLAEAKDRPGGDLRFRRRRQPEVLALSGVRDAQRQLRAFRCMMNSSGTKESSACVPATCESAGRPLTAYSNAARVGVFSAVTFALFCGSPRIPL